MESQRVRHDLATKHIIIWTFIYILYVCDGEENGNPLQYSCLDNPMNRGTWRGYRPWVAKELGTTEWLNNTYVKSKCILTNSQIFIIFINFSIIFKVKYWLENQMILIFNKSHYYSKYIQIKEPNSCIALSQSVKWYMALGIITAYFRK